jgi:hypothetical protein
LVVSVAPAEQCYDKPSVNEDVSGHSPWLASTSSF